MTWRRKATWHHKPWYWLLSPGLFWPRIYNAPLVRYVKSWVAHVPGMPGTFSPPPTSKETDSWRLRYASRHVRDARAVMHVGVANPRVRGKRSRHSRPMRNPQFYVSGKRPMAGSSPLGTKWKPFHRRHFQAHSLSWMKMLTFRLKLVMAWHRKGDKSLPRPCWPRSPTHICCTKGRWDNKVKKSKKVKIASFNLWVRYLVWNFKEYLGNFTQNILPIHWKMCVLQTYENARALRIKSIAHPHPLCLHKTSRLFIIQVYIYIYIYCFYGCCI